MNNQSAEQFLALFNKLHKAICRELGVEDTLDFSTAVRNLKDQRRYWRSSDHLLQVARLRNLLSHNTLEPGRPLAYPAQWLNESLIKILNEIENPSRLIPSFKRQVTSITPDTPLSQVLALVKDLAYSQFPVYSTSSDFLGLLTENGIVSYLATASRSHETIIDLDDVPTKAMLEHDSGKSNYRFMSRYATVEELVRLFADKPELEAVLITHSAKASETLLGIATRYDVVRSMP